MTSSLASTNSASQHSTPASSPPPADMNNEGVSASMQDEEDRMRTQREKNDAKRDAQLEKEREEDIKSGREILDKKFQQLEFLMNKSKVSITHYFEVGMEGISLLNYHVLTNNADESVTALRNRNACANATARRRRESARRDDGRSGLKT